MIPAAPVIRKSISTLKYPGLTDFTSIFIASELNAREYRTTLRHEQAHVWAGHNRRTPKAGDRSQWDIACEMEIARNIYDEKDIETIQLPRSRLAGAYLPDSIESLPAELLLAEEIYEWLLANRQQNPATHTCGAKCSNETQNGTQEQEPASISEVRNKLDKEEAVIESTIAAKTAYSNIMNRPPSLVECLDAALRYRIVRESSHRRPSRRPTCSDVILKGKLSVPRPPLVEIFVDRSGSFTPQKTSAAEETARSILARYGSSIRYDVYYFGNSRLSEKYIAGGGDTPYHLIPEHLKNSRPKIAIIITDDDPATATTLLKGISLICIPIGCTRTTVSGAFGGRDVVLR
jgi:predicted metal-dependent peptidase